METTNSFRALETDGPLRAVVDLIEEPVYFYEPVFEEGSASRVVDLVIVARNQAADQMSYGQMMSLGVRASTVFADMDKALDAANSAWQSGRSADYRLERDFDLESGVLHYVYDVATVRVGDLIAQVCSDRTFQVKLERSEQLLRSVLETMEAGVALLRPVIRDGHLVDAEIQWRNQASRRLWRAVHQGVIDRASEFAGAERWLDLAEEAWHEGSAVDTLELARFPDAPWTTATQTIHRVGDLLLEFTVDMSWEYELIEASQDAQNLLRSVIEGTGDSVAVFEPVFVGDELSDLRYTFLNSAYARLHPGARIGALVSASSRLPAVQLREAATVWRTGAVSTFAMDVDAAGVPGAERLLTASMHRIGELLLEVDRVIGDRAEASAE